MPASSVIKLNEYWSRLYTWHLQDARMVGRRCLIYEDGKFLREEGGKYYSILDVAD